MKDIDLNGKCGSCYYFHLIEGTANGECHKFPYGDDVVHDAAHPFFQPGRSRIKCKNYRTTPITNYDRLRAKSVEEMAEFLTLIMMGEERSVPFIYSTVDKWLDWLKQGVAE